MQASNPNQYLKDADLLFSKHEVSQAIANIATLINADFDSECPVVLSVMTGATVFAGQLVQLLTFPLELDYVHATRYQDGTEGHNVSWIVKPKANIKDKHVLILDDILDQGLTLKSIVDACDSLGAKSIKIAVMVEKEINKPKSIEADYVGLMVPDRYVFGCGMDVHGWWRNLPAIYALKHL